VLWVFKRGKAPDFQRLTTPLVIDSWTETPWQLIKPGLSPDYLGIPGLKTWLNANSAERGSADPAPYLTHWHYRWALPFSCLVTVLLAAPLGIYFSRRGSTGAVFTAVVLSSLVMLTSTVVLALGESGKIHPALAAWLPNFFFATIGIYLFYRRITGRPIYHSLRKLFPSIG
jgi:lipopolysaccharide export LptBFGC system permease protein LptF